MRAHAALLLVAACGRINFDPLGGTPDAPGDIADGVVPAAPVGIGSTFMVSTAPGASVTVDVPPGVQPGDLLLLAMYLNQQNASVTVTAPWQTVFSMVDVNMFRAAFFERVVLAGDPSSYAFPVANTNNVSWALVAYRGATTPVTDLSGFLTGTPSASNITYTTPAITSQREVALLVMDDGGSGLQMNTWTSPPGMVQVAFGYRVAIFRGNLGAVTQMLTTAVDVPNSTGPHGAFRAVAW